MRTDSFTTRRPPWLDLALGLLWVGPAWDTIRLGLYKAGAHPVWVLVPSLVLISLVAYRTVRRDNPHHWGGLRRMARLLTPSVGLLYVAMVLGVTLTYRSQHLLHGDPRLALGAVVEGSIRSGLFIVGLAHLFGSRPNLLRPIAWLGALAAAIGGTWLASQQLLFSASPPVWWGIGAVLGWAHALLAIRVLGPGSRQPSQFRSWLVEHSRERVRMVLPAAGPSRDAFTSQQVSRALLLAALGYGLVLANLDTVGVPLAYFGLLWTALEAATWAVAAVSRTEVTLTPTRAMVTRRLALFQHTQAVDSLALNPLVTHDATGPMLYLGDGVLVAADVPPDALLRVVLEVRAELSPESRTDAHRAHMAMGTLRHLTVPASIRRVGIETTRQLGVPMATIATVCGLAAPVPTSQTDALVVAMGALWWLVTIRTSTHHKLALSPAPARIAPTRAVAGAPETKQNEPTQHKHQRCSQLTS